MSTFFRSGDFRKILTWSMRGLPRPKGDKYYHEFPHSDLSICGVGGKMRGSETMTDYNDTVFLNMLALVVDKHGCRLVEVDLDNQVIKFEGPEDKKVGCALAIQTLLG